MREQAFKFTGMFQGEGGEGGICWASFLVLRSGSTMPRHDLADFLCAFGQANYAAYQWTHDVEQRRCSNYMLFFKGLITFVWSVCLVYRWWTCAFWACSCPRGM